MARWFERFLLATRWLLAPFYLGLLVGLLALMVKAGQHVLHIAQTLLTATESETLLSVLGLVDLTLGASLVVIIMFSGYESFITAISTNEHSNWPVWLTKIDFTGMKLKLLASIVAISAVQLLRQFMNIGESSDRELYWTAGIHVTFVVSSLMLAVTDWLSDHAAADQNNSAGH